MKWLKRLIDKIREWFKPKPKPNPPLDLPDGTQWVFGFDIDGWRETMKLTNAQLTPKGFDGKGNPLWQVYGLDYTRLQDIPRYYVPGDPNNVYNVNGSVWLIREFKGQWYCGTIDYLRVGQREKEFAINDAFLLDPKPGDRVGFMVSTMNRKYDGTIVTGDPESPYRERSNIVWITWPE